MRKIANTVPILATVVLLTAGCAMTQAPVSDEPVGVEPANSYDTEGLIETTVKLSDGREVVCVIINGHLESAISCDWEGASADDREEVLAD